MLKNLGLTAMLCVAMLLQARGQYVTIPDTGFVNFLQAAYPNCMVGNQMDTTCSDIVTETLVDVSYQGDIRNLDGIQYFDNLDSIYALWCWNLASLRRLPAGLKYLDVESCNVDTIWHLPDSLVHLNLIRNVNKYLPPLPATLRRFYIAFHDSLVAMPAFPNELEELDIGGSPTWYMPGTLPDSLKLLACRSAGYTSLPPLPNKLERLYCPFNQLTTLPTLPGSLKELVCSENQIDSLPLLSGLLTELKCDDNLLTELPALPAGLITLKCNNNLLTKLPTLPPALRRLECYFNALDSLPAFPNALNAVFCNNNNLSTLPPPNRISLLVANNNQLTTLPWDLSGIFTLDVSNNLLTSLGNLSTGMFNLLIGGNPLECLPKLPTQVSNFDFDSTNLTCLPSYPTILTSVNPPLTSLPLCQPFNASGCDVFHNISGQVYLDVDSNCNKNLAIDTVLKNVKLLLYENNQLIQQQFSGIDGLFSMDLDNRYGSYVLSVDSVGTPFSVSCPPTVSRSRSVVISATDSIFLNEDFGLNCGPMYDVGVHNIELLQGRFRPASIPKVSIMAGDLSQVYGLSCAAGVSGQVTLRMSGPATILGFEGMSPISSTDSTATWDVPDFDLVDMDTSFLVEIGVDTFILGGDVCFEVVVTPTVGDADTTNNQFSMCFELVNSYDPNDKQVYPSGDIDSIQEWLYYTIRFQNTGTAPALHVQIMDTLDSNLDWSSIQLLSYSHPNNTEVSQNGEVAFNFPNINLPDSTSNEPESHGYISYKIKLKENLPFGTTIENNAHIYFDFNPAIVTNTTVNTIKAICAPTFNTLSVSSCNYFIDNQGDTLISSGSYTEILVNANGCDSVLTTNLTILPNVSALVSKAICSGDSYAGYSISGTYTDILTSVAGCDSTRTLNLAVEDTIVMQINRSICDGETYAGYSTAGTYTDVYSTSFGCDSTVILSLTVNAEVKTDVTASINQGDSIYVGGAWQTEAGDYTDILSTSQGCDSIVTTQLSILVGIAEIERTKLNLYPNPTTGNLTIQTEGELIQQIHLFDLVGKQVLAKRVVQQSITDIDASGLAEGLYIVRVQTTEGWRSGKVMIVN